MASSSTILPRKVALKTRVASFMLSSISGRRHLEDLEKKATDKPLFCGHCSAGGCFRRCLTCRGIVCELCLRTLDFHDGHQMETLEEKTYYQSPAPPPKGSYCNACGCSPLTVPYYHCTVCEDYDLCDSCERINDTLVKRTLEMLHDPAHPMIKYRQQRPVVHQ
jgi:hypothetical protein